MHVTNTFHSVSIHLKRLSFVQYHNAFTCNSWTNQNVTFQPQTPHLYDVFYNYQALSHTGFHLLLSTALPRQVVCMKDVVGRGGQNIQARPQCYKAELFMGLWADSLTPYTGISGLSELVLCNTGEVSGQQFIRRRQTGRRCSGQEHEASSEDPPVLLSSCDLTLLLKAFAGEGGGWPFSWAVRSYIQFQCKVTILIHQEHV